MALKRPVTLNHLEQFCWFRVGSEVQPAASGRRSKQCENCCEMVRESRIPYHGMPRSQKKVRLSEDAEYDVLFEVSRKGIYIYGSALHTRSLILKDLIRHYGSEKHVRAVTSTVESRIRMCGDLYELRLRREISIRMSLTRDTDRYTGLLAAEIDVDHGLLVRSSATTS